MASAPERPIRLGCFDVRNGSVVVADESVPVAAEFNLASGAVARVFSWPILNDRRNRPTGPAMVRSGSAIPEPAPSRWPHPFRAADRPGIRFARRWRLYDELGNPCDHEYATVYLDEDIIAAGGGLPATARCVPDADGIVWFQHPVPAGE